MSPLLHVWGDGQQVAPFHPESVAVAYFVSECVSEEVAILPDSNYAGSYDGKLPYLQLEEGHQVHGYKGIVRYFEKQRALKHHRLKGAQKLQNEGFLEYLTETFGVITAYNLFLDKENYVGHTRPLFMTLLPFPLQYKPPMDFREEASRQCEDYGISANNSFDEDNSEEMDKIVAEERELKDTPILNDTQKTQVERQLETLAMKKGILTNMKCIRLLEEIVDAFTKLAPPKYSKSWVLFYSYVQANTLPALKTTFVRDYLAEKHADLLLELKTGLCASQPAVQKTSPSLLAALKSAASVYI